MKTFQVFFKDKSTDPVTVTSMMVKLEAPFWCFYSNTTISGLKCAYNCDDVASIREVLPQPVTKADPEKII